MSSDSIVRCFSVLMSVYIRESPASLELALESLLHSTLMASEVVLVEDGPLTDDLYSIIEKYRSVLKIKSVKIERNIGLGKALNLGLDACKHEIIARCDTDDINRPQRFEKQLQQFSLNPKLALLSGWVEEFIVAPGDAGVIRKVPEAMDIAKSARSRSPFNHPCVMFKKSAVIACGGYQDDYLYEDYALWVRMLSAGVVSDNIQEVLVDMRAGSDMHKRRGGVKYAKHEFNAQYGFYKLGFISFLQLLKNLAIRIPVRLAPSGVRSFIYTKILR
ncbi:glycosyltransferase [Iodobacter ciconiae]|uniref:Glycosyltransferase n=1 Tax=Iodobacter ciconiae TaxID=2496266 RepID=A0A3S8ZWR9_9NEIS|nr:glycosyltransferase [Iodobacter ciconiae]AZN37864.1 glycosyltransferase [Iodobacter ciconiae]